MPCLAVTTLLTMLRGLVGLSEGDTPAVQLGELLIGELPVLLHQLRVAGEADLNIFSYIMASWVGAEMPTHEAIMYDY